MLKFREIFQEVVVKAFQHAYQIALDSGPKVALALIILLFSWVCALLIKKIISKLLKALGIDVLGGKLGMTNFLENGGVHKKPSSLIGLVFYWLIIFSALIMVFDILELEVVSQFIQQSFLYIPKFIVALILLMLGIFVSRFVGKFVQTSARLANILFYSAIGKTARCLTIGLAVIWALEYLGVATNMIIQLGIIIFVVVPVIIFLILFIGGKDIIQSALAGRLLREIYAKGDMIEFDAVSGQIKSFGIITTKIKCNGGEMIVPHAELIRKTVKRGKHV